MPDYTTDFVITMEEIERYFIYSIDPVGEVSNKTEKYLLAVIQWLYQRQNPYGFSLMRAVDNG